MSQRVDSEFYDSFPSHLLLKVPPIPTGTRLAVVGPPTQALEMQGRKVSNRETYRRKALHCLRAADTVHDSGERIALLSLATNYKTLADYVGSHEDRRVARRGDSSRDD